MRHIGGRYPEYGAPAVPAARAQVDGRQHVRQVASVGGSGSGDSSSDSEGGDAKVPDKVPDALWLECPAMKLVEGGYVKMGGGTTVRGRPVWQHSRKKFVIYYRNGGGYAVAETLAAAHNDDDFGVRAAKTKRSMGPHEVAGWTVGGAASETTSCLPETLATVSYAQLDEKLRRQGSKLRRHRHSLFYMLFCALQVLWVLAEWTPAMYWTKVAVEHEVAADVWQGIGSREDMYGAVQSILPRMWGKALGVGGQGDPSIVPGAVYDLYQGRPYAADPGKTLRLFSARGLKECIDECEGHPECRSISFSSACRRCFLRDKCIAPLTPKAEPPDSCRDMRTYSKPCDATPQPGLGAPAAQLRCPTTQVTVTLGCEGILGTDGFSCNSTRAEEVVEEEAAAVTRLEVFPLGGVLLRQSRVDKRKCLFGDAENAIPEDVRKHLPTLCAPHYSAGASSSTPYGKAGDVFVADVDRAPDVRFEGPPIFTTTADYVGKDRFTVTFPFEMGLAAAQAEVASMWDRRGWMDDQTRLVSLEAIYFTPQRGLFVHATLFAEFLENGLVKAGALYYVFNVFSFDDPWTGLVVALDVLSLVGVLLIFRLGFCRPRPPPSEDLVKNLILEAPLKPPPAKSLLARIREATHFTLYEVAFFACWVYAVVLRIQLWVQALEMGPSYYAGKKDVHVAMFNWLWEYNDLLDAWNAIIGAIALLALMRLLRFGAHTKRLKVLADTVTQGAGDVLGVLITAIPLLAAYALGGAVMFGHLVKEFRSFSEALSTLVTFMLTNEVHDMYADLSAARGEVLAALYLGTYFFMSAVLFINLVLAAVAGAYAVVTELATGPSTTKARPLVEQCVVYFRDYFEGMCPVPLSKKRPGHTRYSSPEVGGFRDTVLELMWKDDATEELLALRSNLDAWAQGELEYQEAKLRRRGLLGVVNLRKETVLVDNLMFRQVAQQGTHPLSAAESDYLFQEAAGTNVPGEDNLARDRRRRFEKLHAQLLAFEDRLELSDSNFDAMARESQLLVEEQAEETGRCLDRMEGEMRRTQGVSETKISPEALTTGNVSSQVKLLAVLLQRMREVLGRGGGAQKATLSPQRRPQHREMAQALLQASREDVLRRFNPAAPLPSDERGLECAELAQLDPLRQPPPPADPVPPPPAAAPANPLAHSAFPLSPTSAQLPSFPPVAASFAPTPTSAQPPPTRIPRRQGAAVWAPTPTPHLRPAIHKHKRGNARKRGVAVRFAPPPPGTNPDGPHRPLKTTERWAPSR